MDEPNHSLIPASEPPPPVSEKTLWSYIGSWAIAAGRSTIEYVLQLYYTAQEPETPLWAKSIIYSALAYFILPLDAIPDTLPVVGFSDDLGALAAAVAAVSIFITKPVREKAARKLEEWFGKKG
jgi:uncharacterized membrane protein YkvA (DUF1232 family)